MIAAVKAGVVAIGDRWIHIIFCCVISTDIDTGARAILYRFVLVAFLVYHGVVTALQVTVILVVISADRLAVGLTILC